ncbi:PP2C family protein-serine/threonine phosphatase [Azospirillum sp. YIM B02556]|uniref:PP2C family protein-serine/threonine phosphatase n=1 Tax=Azospirillum endophyticum TaxID=2800326 RepID=A0ABS1EZN4_9PROT|nr:PP2C family protein-serine/threonine phosphatase [Azospirillum endophyticum]MBK1836620.1 PP2C family protein-serine/threonine phosphatase [Azospirillum endophyticum]
MLLQTRIILFVLATVTVVAGLLLGFSALREDAADHRARELELARLDTSWQLAVSGAVGRIDQGLGRLAGDAEIARAVEAEERGALDRRVAALGIVAAPATGGITDVNLLSKAGDLLYSSDPAFDPAPLLNRGSLDAILSGQKLARGVRLVDGDRMVVVAGVPVYAGTGAGGGAGSGAGVAGAAVAGVDFAVALDVLRRTTGGRVFAVTRNGAALDGESDPLWPVVKPLVRPADRSIAYVSGGGRRYALASLPVADLAGGRVATVLIASDVTQAVEEQALWSVAYVAAVGLVLLGALGLLYGFLRRNFSTLDGAVKALQDLSRGRSMGYVELPAGNDEIGRIAGAVEVFRGVMREIERSAGQRERRLRRQQRFIRRQMEALAVTLEEDARQNLLEELRQIEAETHDAQSAQSKGVGDELGLLALGFSRLATRVSTQQVQLTQMVRDLREALADKRRLISLQQELEIARTMQLTILPQVFPDMAEFDIAARMIPAKEVGGDFYDFFPISEHKVALVIADVSGKGIPAAFFMLITRTMLRAIAESGVGPAETMRRVNNLLAAENEQMMFVTVFYGELDLRTGVLAFSNGGHNPPLRMTAAGAVKELERTPGIALAAMPDMPFGEKSVTLDTGDMVVLFTDGVTEAFNGEDVMYGDTRLVSAVGRQADASVRDGLDGVLADVARFTAGAPQSDDITCLVLRWRGSTETSPLPNRHANEVCA